MAPLPPSNTERYKVKYTNNGHQHVMDIRTDTVSPSAFGAELDLLFQAVTSLLFDTVIDEVLYAASGSDIFNTVSSGIEGNTYGGGGTLNYLAANFFSFVGRSAGGRRVRLYFFGCAVNTAIDYRFSPGENAAIDAACILLNAATPQYLSIDNVKPVWKSYANVGVNAHWQKALRP